LINAAYKKNDKISYTDALATIAVDQESNTWGIRKNNASNDAYDTISVRSGLSRAKSDMFRNNTLNRSRERYRLNNTDLLPQAASIASLNNTLNPYLDSSTLDEQHDE
jgi:hypothetical protein